MLRTSLLASSILAAGATLSLVLAVGSQGFITIDGNEIVFEDFPVPGHPPAAPSPGGDAEGEQPKEPSELLKAIQKLKFDRRPSKILEAWAQPELEPLADEPPPEETSEGQQGEGEDDQDEGQAAEAQPSTESADETAPAEPAEEAEQPAAEAPEPSAAEAAEGLDETSSDDARGEDDEPQVDPAEAARLAAEAKAEKEAEKAAEKAEKERKKKLEEWNKKKLERDIEIFERNVTLGRWERVAELLGRLEDDEPVTAYEYLLTALAKAPQTPEYNQIPRQYHEKNSFSIIDIMALAEMAPGEERLTKEQAALIAPLCAQALEEGHVVEELFDRLGEAVALPDEQRQLEKRAAAWILSAIGENDELGAFLPGPEQAEAEGDREALNLLARYYLALYSSEPKVVHLEQAWKVTQAALASGEVEEEDKQEALRRAVELAPKIRDEFGEVWLAESFTERPERGREVLATMGGLAALGFLEHAKDTDFREQGLALQKAAVDALLSAAPELATQWRESLNRLASNWLAEAQHSYTYSEATSLGPSMERDSFGNIYYYNYNRSRNQPVTPLEPADLLDERPQGRWLELLDESVQPRFAIVAAQLYLKVNEEAQAFPYIEMLSASHPVNATELAEEFLRVWTRNNNPNSANSYTSSYMYMFGFEQRANGIPLTRSKQERNLTDLGQWVTRLRGLPIFDEIDDELFVQAFTQCHSSAEVYRLEKLEAVFGALDQQDPDTIAGLVQKMRTNLGDVWRKPSTQEDAKTKRRQKDIEREVLAGYELARQTLEQAIQRNPDNWKLVLAEAALSHDENNYRQELAKSSGFTEKRLNSLAGFERAAQLYLDELEELSIDDETTEPFEFWFYAGLGAVDLKHLNERTLPDKSTPDKILFALESIRGEAYERHMAKFASSLFTRLSAVNPACKYRYLDAGFEIVGDHPAAQEARKVLDYYRDLVHEIQLVASVDGSDTVGWEQPFGLRVDLRHTKEIERESGGFAKYLQNQNAGTRYYYNYGRPLEDYRDKFQEAATTALSEHFDVLSVTFNAESVTSKADAEYGWRVTPYAYILLEARGPQVDSIPPLQLDLDFLDTSGYAVLPIASSAIPIDATAQLDQPRPYAELGVTQILDERKADEGKLVLEIKASAKGLVPDLEDILELQPDEFTIAGIDDQGVSISQFDEEQQIEPLSERLWTVSLIAKADLDEHPQTFQFATPKVEVEENIYQRYADADLVTAEQSVTLGELYGDPGFPWVKVLLPLVVGLGALAFWLQSRRSKALTTDDRGLRLPDPLTPFAVITLLREVESANSLPPSTHTELRETIERLEQHYFSQQPGTPPDLRSVAERWVRLVG